MERCVGRLFQKHSSTLSVHTHTHTHAHTHTQKAKMLDLTHISKTWTFSRLHVALEHYQTQVAINITWDWFKKITLKSPNVFKILL